LILSILDFKEIPEAHIANGLQDTFELFARDFLLFIGYKIITDPDRGADGGVDLIVEEIRSGVGGETTIRWLVSCKHKAHSGKSVSPNDDANIRDRVEANDCDGFIGFYSTLASSGLSGNLEGMKSKIEYQVFDKEKIESKILHSAKGLEIAERYFPNSLDSWKTNNPQPARIFSNKPSLKCKVCNKELFDQDDNGVVTLWEKMRKDYKNEPKQLEYVFWTCRGRCDDVLSASIHEQRDDVIDGWEDISDVMMPTIYIKWVMSIMNQLQEGDIYSDEAFDSIKSFLLGTFPYIARHLTDKEKERIDSLGMIPSYMGGLNYES
jgi:hypothetical protein